MAGRSILKGIWLAVVASGAAPLLAAGNGPSGDPSYAVLFALGVAGLVIGLLGARQRPSD